MTKKTIYYVPASPPARFACTVASHLGIDVDLKIVDLSKGEHLKPEYLAINPAGTVPAYADGDFKLFDSAAIAIYLADKYAKDDSFYPKDAEKRAKVNEKLFYCSGTIFPTGGSIFLPVIFGNATDIPPEVFKKFERISSTVEAFFNDGNEYITGNSMTIADIFLWSLYESVTRILTLDPKVSGKTIKWLEKMRQHPSNDFQQKGAEMHIGFYKQCLERNKAAASK